MAVGNIALATTLLGALCLPSALYAQVENRPEDPPESVWLRLGPLALAPAITLANFGWDSNVFQRPEDLGTVGDLTATPRSELRSWLRLGRARVTFRGNLDYVYFRDYANERSTDWSYDANISVPQGRFAPYFSTRGLSARQRFSFEIDDRTRRRENVYNGGVVMRLGARTSIDVAARRNRLEFTPIDGLQDPLISNYYDYTSHGLSLTLRRDLTPLTSLAVNVYGNQDRFDVLPARDSDSVAVSSGFEFKPFALITGKAFVGWTRVQMIHADRASFSSFVTSIDLAYTLMGATRLTFQAERGLSYSAMQGQHAYLLAGVKGTATHRLNGSWDIGGRAARYRADYDTFDLLPGTDQESVLQDFDETITEFGGQIGYLVGPRTRLSFDIVRYHRRSTLAAVREYIVNRVGVTIGYQF